MAANGITLTPIRMGDVLSQDAAKKASGSYVPPCKRGSQPVIPQKIDMTEKSFPALGFIPKKLPSWGKHVVAEPIPDPEPSAEAAPKPETLSDKIQEKMRLNAISGLLSSVKETDPLKMSDTELAANGWARLRLDKAREITMANFEKTIEPCIPGCIAEADSGMTFEGYEVYKKTERWESKQEYYPSDDDYDE